ncbi:MAG: hypothetical protein IT350_02465 [Deltaproteobacteria bacterium]|nr:hypothetical protein [Deltaproteobacteria bacterium]
MEFERVNPQQIVPYIPEFGGERRRACENRDYAPCAFHLRPMTVAEYERASVWTRDGDGFALAPDTVRDTLTRHVTRVEHLRFADGEEIADGAAVAAARERAGASAAPLYLEILAAIRDVSVLREGERKNSDSPRASS